MDDSEEGGAMMISAASRTIGAILAAVSLTAASAAGTDVASAAATKTLRQNTYGIAVNGHHLSGEGSKVLLESARGAQFVAIGEEHNSADIPPFVTALFAELHAREGFNYLAEEQDAAITRIISAPPLRGNFRALTEQASREKHSFTFDSDEELQMLSDVANLSTGHGRPIWGCEQAFGATHILERLVAAAPSPQARRLATNLLEQARSREAVRGDELPDRYLMDPSIAAQMPELERLYRRSSNSEARDLASILAKSFEIYHYYYNGDHHQLPGYFANNAVREDHMKTLCRDEYLRALSRDKSTPRALLKFGHWHLFRGMSPGDVPTTGAFFADLAKLNRLGFVSIAFLSKEYGGTPLWADEDSKGYKAFAPVLDSPSWKLIDLRPLREYGIFKDFKAGAGETLSAEAAKNIEQLVYGFDFAIIKPASHGAHFSHGQRN